MLSLIMKNQTTPTLIFQAVCETEPRLIQSFSPSSNRDCRTVEEPRRSNGTSMEMDMDNSQGASSNVNEILHNPL